MRYPLQSLCWLPVYFGLLLLFLQLPSVQARTLAIGNGDWAPHQGRQLSDGGPASRIVKEAFATQGIDVEFHFLPWARGLDMTAQTDLDAIFLFSYNEQRGTIFLYSDPLIVLDTVVFYHIDNPIIWSDPEELKGLELGAVISFDYGLVTEAAGFALNRIAEPVNNYHKLAAGRVDGVLDEVRVGQELAEEAGVLTLIDYHPTPVKRVPYHLIVSRQHPEAEAILQSFNTGLAELQSSGRFAELVQ